VERASKETKVSKTCGTLQIKEILVEESNVQPVNSPVTVRTRLQAMPFFATCTVQTIFEKKRCKFLSLANRPLASHGLWRNAAGCAIL
jgi:hypothetical protein